MKLQLPKKNLKYSLLSGRHIRTISNILKNRFLSKCSCYDHEINNNNIDFYQLIKIGYFLIK